MTIITKANMRAAYFKNGVKWSLFRGKIKFIDKNEKARLLLIPDG
jgi:hypothetical protein